MKYRLPVLGSVTCLAAACVMSVSQLGAQAAEAAKDSGMTGSVTLGAGGFFRDGNDGLFREHRWQNDRFAAGIENLSIQDGDWSLEGRAIGGEQDFKLKLAYEPKEGFFFRAGAENFRHYFDDAGRYRAHLEPNVFFLNRDLYLDVGKIWAEAGVKSEEGWNFLVGYEYDYKTGDKSLLEEGTVTTGGVSKRVYPATKDVEEGTHILKLEVSKDFNGLEVADTARFEWYGGDSYRNEQVPATVSAPSVTGTEASGYLVDEDFKSHTGSNAFTVEKWVTDKLFLAAGHMYIHTDGTAEYWMDQYPGLGYWEAQPAAGPPAVGGGIVSVPNGALNRAKFFQAQDVNSTTESNIFGLNGFFNLTPDVSLGGGLQYERTSTDVDGDLKIIEGAQAGGAAGPPDTRTYYLAYEDAQTDSTTDTDRFEDSLELRVDTIPNTRAYAQARFVQANYDDRIDEYMGVPYVYPVGAGVPPGSKIVPFADVLEKDLRTEVDERKYRLGFTTSPCAAFSISPYVQTSVARNNYDNSVGDYFESMDRDSNEVGLKLTGRLTNWLKTSVKYQHIETRFEKDSAAGGVSDAEQTTDAYSLNATISPNDKLYLSSTLVYYFTTTTADDVKAVTVYDDYEGNVATLLNTLQYALTDRTDVVLGVNLAQADNDQNQNVVAGGFPINLSYASETVSVGFNRQFTQALSGKIRYVFYNYRDQNGGADGLAYTAHGVFGSLTMKF